MIVLGLTNGQIAERMGAVGWLLIGSIPGILIGSQLSVGIPDRILRLSLSAVLVLSGIKLLDVPQSSTIIVVGLAVGAVVLAASLFRQYYVARTVAAPVSSPELP